MSNAYTVVDRWDLPLIGHGPYVLFSGSIQIAGHICRALFDYSRTSSKATTTTTNPVSENK